jgi:hypothetical protein
MRIVHRPARGRRRDQDCDGATTLDRRRVGALHRRSANGGAQARLNLELTDARDEAKKRTARRGCKPLHGYQA